MTHPHDDSDGDHDEASAAATVERLIAAAREHFAEDGFAATSLDAVVERAGVTKGALYHHFSGKADLFGDVFEDEQAKLAGRVARASAEHEDPWDAATAGLHAFLDACLDPGVQRIVLIDAPSALGVPAMRDLEAPYGLALIREALRRVRAAGDLPDADESALAHLLFGATCEAAMYIARAEDPRAARDEMEGELRTLLENLRKPTLRHGA